MVAGFLCGLLHRTQVVECLHQPGFLLKGVDMKNLQKPEPIIPEKDELNQRSGIDIVDIWKTIQGEGPFVGTVSVFIRLAGCDRSCPLCDTDYTSGRRMVLPYLIESEVRVLMPSNKGLVVITGGEPFRQNINELVSLLIQAGYTIQIETNGDIYREDFGNYESPELYIVCSPKGPIIHPKLLPYVYAFKYVVDEGNIEMNNSGLPLSTLGQRGRVAWPPKGHKAQIFISPCDEGDPGKNRRNVEVAVKSCFKFGHRLSLQIHKLIGVP